MYWILSIFSERVHLKGSLKKKGYTNKKYGREDRKPPAPCSGEHESQNKARKTKENEKIDDKGFG